MSASKTAGQSSDTFGQLVAIDKKVDEYDKTSLDAHKAALRERWEFGRLMVAAREGKKQLPKGFMEKLAKKPKKAAASLATE